MITLSHILLSAGLVLSAGVAHGQTVSISGAPSGFGLAGATGAASIAGTYGPDRGDTNYDASTSLSLGFGDAVSGVGVMGSMNLTSFRDFGASGYFSLGLHKMFQFDDRGIFSVAASASYLGPWGDATAEDPGYSLVGTYLTSFGDSLGMLTLGVANDLSEDRGEWELIAGIGGGVGDNLAVSIAQSGSSSILGLSVAPDAIGGNSLGFTISSDGGSDDATFGFTLGRSFSLRGN